MPLYIGWCFLDLKWTFYRALLPIYIKKIAVFLWAYSRARLYLQIHVRYLFCNFTCAMTQFSSFYIMITALSQCSWNVPITLFLLQQMKYWIYRCLTDNCFCLLHILFVFATCCQQFGGNICQLTIILWSLPSLNVPNMFRLLGCYAKLNLQNVSQVFASYIQYQPIFPIETYSPNCWWWMMIRWW